MNLVGAYAGNVASNWISSTVEGAKEAAAAYGGNLAGDIVIAGGNLIDGAGRAVGNTVAGYADRYGNWVTGYGDKLQGKSSVLPKSGPLGTYKAGGAGAGALKRSASYGPATSSSKALTKSPSISKPKNNQHPAAVRPYQNYNPAKNKKTDKPKEGEKALSKTGNSKYPTSAVGKKTGSAKPNYPKGPSTSTANKYPSGPNKKYPSGPSPSIKGTGGSEKASGLADKKYGGGHVPLPGGIADAKGDNGGAKGYTPYRGPQPNKEKEKQQGGGNKTGGGGGGHLGLPSGIGDSKSEAGGAKPSFKPYTPHKGNEKKPGAGVTGAAKAGGDLIPNPGGKAPPKPGASKPATGGGAGAGGAPNFGNKSEGNKDGKMDRTFF